MTGIASAEGAGAPRISPGSRAQARRTISDGLWGELSRLHAEPQLIELCMLVGHYEMLAMTLNSLGVQPDPPGGEVPRPLRFVQRLAERRAAR